MATYFFSAFYILILIMTSFSGAVVPDNRFIPFLYVPHFFSQPMNTQLKSAMYFATATDAYNTADRNCSLPEFYGAFDLGVLSRAYAQVSGNNPLRSYFQDKSMPFIVDGKIKMQGVAVGFDWIFSYNIGIAGSCMLSRLYTEYTFLPDSMKFAATDGMYNEIDQQRRLLFTTMGITEENNTRFGIAASEINIFFQHVWERRFRFRSIMVKPKIGLMFPSTFKAELYSPSTLMQAEQQLWGGYLACESRFILKEDFWIELYMFLSKRFSQSVDRRLPVLTEPFLYGAEVGKLLIDPGVTFSFCPSVVFARIRGGLGVAASYTLTYHQHDHFEDRRVDNSVNINLGPLKKISNWGSDYVSLHLFYDFSDRFFEHEAVSFLKLKWDIPTDFFVAKRVAKTHNVMIGIEYAF